LRLEGKEVGQQRVAKDDFFCSAHDTLSPGHEVIDAAGQVVCAALLGMPEEKLA
jgi:hypothetical protein